MKKSIIILSMQHGCFLRTGQRTREHCNFAAKNRNMNNNLTIKLISPRMSLRPMDSEMKRRMSPPFSLVTLASMTPEQHFVYIEDENIGKINFDDNPDLVGITVNVDTVYRAFEISGKCRSKGTKAVFGGIHASACPQEMLGHCDAVCIGEAENLWERIIADCSADNLKPAYFHTEPTDLSLIPIADWNFIKHKEKYLYYNVVVTSRGCPFRCEFCYNSCDYVSGKYRNRPVKNKVETMTGHILTPYPGTILHKKLEKENRIICDDLEKYNTSHVVFQPANLTPEQLQKGYRKMYKDFLFAPYYFETPSAKQTNCCFLFSIQFWLSQIRTACVFFREIKFNAFYR